MTSQTNTTEDDWLGPAPWIAVTPPGPLALATLACDSRVIGPFPAQPAPLVVRRARGSVIEDIDGNRYLDFSAGWTDGIAGHCSPRIVAAIDAQAQRLIHLCSRHFYHEPVVALAHKLEDLAPGKGPRRVVFRNSETEVLQTAIQIACLHKKRNIVLNLSRQVGLPALHTGILISCQAEYGDVAALQKKVQQQNINWSDVAAVLVEPILSDDNLILPPDAYLPELKKLCDQHGILFIADETRTGLGRTGTMFAVEPSGITPDLLCIARGLAGGLPLGAVVALDNMAESVKKLSLEGSSGNAVSYAAALATIDVLEKGHVSNCASLAERAMKKLNGIAQQRKCIGEIHGRGLMFALDIIKKTRKTREPNGPLRNKIVQEAFNHGLIVLSCGENTVRLCPPLCINRTQLDVGLDVFAEAIATVSE